MKKWIRVFALALAFVLLFTGCKKDELPEEPQTPDVPPVETPETPAGPEVPAEPSTPPDPFGGLSPEDEQYIKDHEYWMELMNMDYLIPDEDRTLLDAQLISTDKDNTEHFLVWNIKNGDDKPLYSRLRVSVSLDGKAQSIQLEDDETFDLTCQAIQAYRTLEMDLMHGSDAVVRRLGFEVGQWPDKSGTYTTDILYADFYAAMTDMISPDLYTRRFQPFFSDTDGKLTLHDTAGSGVPYLVDEAALQPDGSYLVKLHGFYAPGNRWDCIGRAVLETREDGSYVVTDWADTSGVEGVDELIPNEDGTYTIKSTRVD